MAKLLIVVMALAAGAWAQTAGSVALSAPESRVIAGAPLQIAATVRDRNGNPMTGVPLTWSSTNDAVAGVDASGTLTTRRPGFISVNALAPGNVRGTLQVQVVPQRIEVTPDSPEMTVGDELQFTARALDVRGQPIAGVTFDWQVAGLNGRFTAAASVSNTGLLSTTATNTVVVRAVISYQVPAEFTPQFVGLAYARIRPPADYRLKRLLTTDETRDSLRLLARRGGMAVNDRGQLAMLAGLDGLASSVLLSDGGPLSLLASGGWPTFLPGGNLIDFQGPAINNRGDTVVRADTIGQGGSLLMLGPTGPRYLITDGTSLPGLLDLQGVNITRFSLADDRTTSFRANFRWDGETTRSNGLFRISGNQVDIDVYSPGRALPGVEGVNYSFDSDYGIDNAGNLMFTAFDGVRQSVIRKTANGEYQKVLATGDALAGSKVRNIFRSGIGRTGEIAVGCSITDGTQYVVRFVAGGSTPEVLALPGGFNQIFTINAAGVLFFGNPGPGWGLYRWAPRAATAQAVLFYNRPAPGGDQVLDIDQAGMAADGTVFVKVRTTASPLQILRIGQSGATVVHKAGDRVAVHANLTLRGIVPGAASGSAHVLMGGYQSSVFQLDAAAGLVPSVLLGDRLEAAPFYGNLPVRKSPDGALYVAVDDGLFRIDATSASAVVRLPRRDADGVTQNGISGANQGVSGAIAANESGAVAWVSETNGGHRRLYLKQGENVQAIAFIGTAPQYRTASPAGGYFAEWQEIAIDGGGRVMARLTVNGGPSGYFLWGGGRWQAAALFGQTSVNERAIEGASELHASGSDFFAIFSQRGVAAVVARYTGDRWTPLHAQAQAISSGAFTNSYRTLAVNRAGDVAVAGNTDGGVPFVILLKGTGSRLALLGNLPTADGTYIVSVPQVDVRDDGTIYFAAFDIFDRYAVYEADPQF